MNCVFSESVYNTKCTGHGAARLARLHGVQEALGSNPSAPTKISLAGKQKRTLSRPFLFWLPFSNFILRRVSSYAKINSVRRDGRVV